MNIKTNLLEEYVKFVDITKKQNKNLWIFTIILVFIVIMLTFIILEYTYKYMRNYISTYI